MVKLVSVSGLEVALLAEAPKQWKRFQLKQAKLDKGKPKWQREISLKITNSECQRDSTLVKAQKIREEGEALRRQYDPELVRINANLSMKIGNTSTLHCPKCHESDRGNKINGKPWCMKCNVSLESRFLAKKLLPHIKVLPKTKKLNVTFMEMK